MTPDTRSAETVTIGGDLTVGRIGYGAMQLTGPKVWGEYPDHPSPFSHVAADD
jgi:pyridoxine 4-dehydrogenase